MLMYIMVQSKIVSDLYYVQNNVLDLHKMNVTHKELNLHQYRFTAFSMLTVQTSLNVLIQMSLYFVQYLRNYLPSTVYCADLMNANIQENFALHAKSG